MSAPGDWDDGSLNPADVHTADRAVPPLDGELAGVLEDLETIHPGIDLICEGIRLLALDRLTTDQTQTLVATLAGSAGADVLTAVALLVSRLTTPATNPALRALPLDQQKLAQQYGEQHLFHLTDPHLHQAPAEAAAAIDSL